MEANEGTLREMVGPGWYERWTRWVERWWWCVVTVVRWWHWWCVVWWCGGGSVHEECRWRGRSEDQQARAGTRGELEKLLARWHNLVLLCLEIKF